MPTGLGNVPGLQIPCAETWSLIVLGYQRNRVDQKHGHLRRQAEYQKHLPYENLTSNRKWASSTNNVVSRFCFVFVNNIIAT